MVGEGSSLLTWHRQLYFRQIVWFVVGLAAAGAVCLVDYRAISRWSYVAYWGMILVLAAVLIPGIGSVHGGARRWIDLPLLQLQPSEFAKVAFILALAHYLSRPVDELRLPVIFWKAICLMALPFVLIMKEPDLGSALVLLPTGLVMLLVAGTPKRLIAVLAGTGLLVGAIFLVDVFFAPPGWWQIKLEDYQRHRLMSYFGMDFAPPNASPEEKRRAQELERQKSYQARQALISVGSGGLTGKGWHEGDQIALGFLPRGAAHTDFIFSVVAEELGFVGSLFVLTLYSAILFTGIKIAGQARDRLGKLLAAGVVTLIFSQVFINIGMNIRIMPVTGVPLPLLSYGGSSVLASLIAMGLLQNVHIYRKGY
jgi:rod shape determining protein RodA